MTTPDDEITPKLGRLRTKGGPRGRRYLQQVLHAIARAGGHAARKAAQFHGSRIGRGAGIGRVLAARERMSGVRARRVIIKSRIVRLAGSGLKAAQLHLRYIQRDGVTPEGTPGQLYDAGTDQADGKAFLERAREDRHQFRFIVSAEDGDQYEDLKPLVRRLMRQMENDLGTRLDWVAVDHHNTGHPHSHIVLRGRDDRDRDLVIARDYMSRGMRERATEIVTLDLGPRSDGEIQERLRQQVEQDRFTDLDRDLTKRLQPDGLLRGIGTAGRDQALLAGRLQKLRRLGLAEETAPGRWQLSPELEPTLRRLGERGDIIKTLHRELTAAKLPRGVPDYAIYDPAGATDRPLIGRVIARGQSDDLSGRHYLVIDGVDGRSHFVDIGEGAHVEATPAQCVVAIAPKRSAPKPADRTIAEIARLNDGLYDAERHRRHDAGAGPEFVAAHVRRLEAMRRLAGIVERQADGIWKIAPDHLERAARFEARQARAAPVLVDILSAQPLERLAAAEGATWLDRQLVGEQAVTLRDGGFGKLVSEARRARQRWLLARGLAWQDEDRVTYRPDLLEHLRRREIARVAAALSQELGLDHYEPKHGQRVAGIYQRRIDLVSGRYALLVGAREFTLVPWRPGLDQHLEKSISGWVRGRGISWQIGRSRGGPAID